MEIVDALRDGGDRKPVFAIEADIRGTRALDSMELFESISRINATLPAYQGRMMETGYPGKSVQPAIHLFNIL